MHRVYPCYDDPAPECQLRGRATRCRAIRYSTGSWSARWVWAPATPAWKAAP